MAGDPFATRHNTRRVTSVGSIEPDADFFFTDADDGHDRVVSAAVLGVADTGELDASSLLATGWTADTGYPKVRRIGHVVELDIMDLDYSSGGSATVMTLPVGFRPATIKRMLVASVEGADDGPTVGQLTIGADGVVSADVLSDNYNGNITYLTTDAFAAALA